MRYLVPSQVPSVRTAAPTVRVTPPAEPDPLATLAQSLRTSRWLIAALVLAGAAGGLALSVLQTPQYRGASSVEILTMNRDFLDLKEIEPTFTSGAEVSTSTQIQLMRSSTLVRRAVERVRSKNLPRGTAGEPYLLLGWTGLRREPADIGAAIDTAAASLEVTPRGDSSLIEISTYSPDPRVSSEFANALAEEYIDRSLELRTTSYQKIREWLGRRVEELRAKLTASEAQLLSYASRGGFTFGNEEQNPTRAKLEQLQAEYSSAQADRIARESRYAQVAGASGDDGLGLSEQTSLQTGNQKLNDLRRELTELRAIYAPGHYKVKQVEAQIAAVEAALRKDRAGIAAALRAEFETSRRREQMLRQAYEEQLKLATQQAQSLLNYSLLKREVEGTRTLYESLLRRVNEAGTAAALREGTAQIVEVAAPASRPGRPQPARNVAYGLICGVFLAVMVVGFRELHDSTMKTPDELIAALPLPYLGVIPATSERRALRRSLPLLPAGEPVPELRRWDGRPTPLVESFRSVLLSLLYSSPSADHSLVAVVISPGAGEGKTTVTANLGAALARSGRSVLLVDADLRRPALHRACGVENERGVSDLLRSEKPVSEAWLGQLVRETAVPNLFVLAAGGSAAEVQTMDPKRVAEIVAVCRGSYATVLVDTPPMLSFADSRVWARCGDGAILVVRAGETPQAAARLAARRLMEDANHVIGTVLNDWDPDRYGHGSARYYAPYAYSNHENVN